MAEVVTVSLIRLISNKLASIAFSEFSLLTGVDKELEKLEKTLSTIEDVLEDAEAGQVKQKALKSWLGKLKELAYDVDDVIDDFVKAAKLNKPNMKEKVCSLVCLPKHIIFRHKIGLRVKEINKRLNEIAEEKIKFHLKEGEVRLKLESSTTKKETGSFINELDVYGRQKDKEMIVQFLLDTSIEDNIGVIGIVGIGGLGKTTLAGLAYNDERVCGHFEKRIWACVSVEFEIRRLIQLIIESATGSEFPSISLDAMQMSLIKVLKGKRFLLVLDDVWNESSEKWDYLRALLTVGARGSKVIVTTRNKRVASIMGTIPPYQLSEVSLYNCWLLFERKAFGFGVERNSNLVEIGKEIVNKCGGVPLAANALGSMLKFKRDEIEWLALRDDDLWKFSFDENYELLPSLKRSYDQLSSDLKQCFSFCSIFPKGYDIDTDVLVKLWGAEGFLKRSMRHMHWEQIGFQYVDELLARSLFQGDMRKVYMHDLVHDLARYVAGNECSIVDVSTGRYLSQDARYASFISHKQPLSAALQSLREAKKLRTFYLETPKYLGRVKELNAQEVLHVISSNANLLRALHLRNYPLKALPYSFKKLKHLRYLDISNTSLKFFPPCITTLHNLQTLNLAYSKIKAIPDSICNLCNLCTLDLGYCVHLSSLPSSIGRLERMHNLYLTFTSIKSLPESICNLSKLHTLDILGCNNLTCMPKNIGKLNQLRRLSMYISGGETSCSLTELGSLKLEGELLIKELQNVKNSDEDKGAHLSDKCEINSLKLSWKLYSHQNPKQGSDDEDEFIIDSPLAEYVLESLQPNISLEILSIEGYVGRAFPLWMELSLLNIIELHLIECASEKIPMLGQLPKLQHLNLHKLPQIKHLDCNFYGGTNAFPSLLALELYCMINLEEWCSTEDEQSFPRLNILNLNYCPKLTALPSDFWSVEFIFINGILHPASHYLKNEVSPR